MNTNGKDKAILLVRVSTQKQDFDEQERELYQLAINDGFKSENIIAVCEKESGIKLKEDERRGLNQMKEIIAQGGVSCVYAWEPSRIARKKKVIFSITDYLVERGIQLVIKEPYIRLLNADGSINDGAETVLTLFGQLAESEMRNKQARWARTRKANAKAGIWNGGKAIRYGYTIDENNRYIIDEEQSKIVKLCYDLYINSQMGQNHLRNELMRRGIELTQDRIRRILSFEGYTGKPVQHTYSIDGVKKLGSEIIYPAIISEEIFAAAQNKKVNANHDAHKGHNYYFCRGLLRCPVCGHLYIGYKNLGQYKCVANKHDNKDIEKCDNNASVNINALDTLLWDATVSEYIKARSQSQTDKKAEYLEQIKVSESIIAAADKRTEKALQKRQRWAVVFANGDCEENVYQQHRNAVEEEISAIRRDVKSAEEKIEHLTKMIESVNQPSYIDVLRNLAEEAFSMNELREMCELVHTYINKVEFEKTTWLGRSTKYIVVTAVDGTKYHYLTRYTCGGQHVHRYYKKCEQLSDYIEEWEEIRPEIIISRKLGRESTGCKDVKIIRNTDDYVIGKVKIDKQTDKQTAARKMIELTEKIKKQ